MNVYSPAVVANLPIVVTLLTGLLIAFAVQLLLTSFGRRRWGSTALGYLPIRRLLRFPSSGCRPGRL